MDDIVIGHAGSILRVELNRPTKRNAMTSTMYVALAEELGKSAVSLAKLRVPHSPR